MNSEPLRNSFGQHRVQGRKIPSIMRVEEDEDILQLKVQERGPVLFDVVLDINIGRLYSTCSTV